MIRPRPTLRSARHPSPAVRAYGQAAAVRIWDNATAPHSNGIAGPEQELEPHRISDTSEAELYLFPADPARATGQGAVVCPGGGYRRLSIDHEGYELARWLASEGIHAAVLKYRVPNGHPEVPLEDAEQALRLLRGEVPGAEGCTAERVGIVGCSAGGHLAALVSTQGRVRPAFSILFYPVITGQKGLCHRGSFDCLLGPRRSERRTARYSLERCVGADTPPALLLLADDDRSVPPVSSTRYYEALKEHGIEASMRIYPSGGHGWGMHDSFPYKADWQAAVLDWLRRPGR